MRSKLMEAICFKLGKLLGPLLSYDFNQVIHAEKAGLDGKLVFYSSSTRGKNLLIILNEISSWNLRDLVFMDVGCGTGYVLRKWDKYFKKSLGVEINPISFNIAKKNLKSTSVVLINDDVLNVDISSVDLFFLYNPFPQKIMIAFLKKIVRNARIIYLNPTSHEVLIQNGWKVILEFKFDHHCYIYEKSFHSC